MNARPGAPVPLSFTDLSARARCGCKGPGAGQWLRSAGCLVPADANSALLDADGVLVARLATSEFLVDAVAAAADSTGAVRVRTLRAQLAERSQPGDVYPVARLDTVATVSGSRLNDLMRQVCSVDFEPLLGSAAAGAGESAQPVVLTSMIGVGVVAWPHGEPAGPAITLWCEPSYGHYFWDTLREVAQDIEQRHQGGVSK